MGPWAELIWNEGGMSMGEPIMNMEAPSAVNSDPLRPISGSPLLAGLMALTGVGLEMTGAESVLQKNECLPALQGRACQGWSHGALVLDTDRGEEPKAFSTVSAVAVLPGPYRYCQVP